MTDTPITPAHTDALAQLAEIPPAGSEDPRTCTCHPDDNPPRPCPQRFAYSECVAAALAAATERNCRVQARHDELMYAGKHGFYETLFQVVREEVERLSLAMSEARKQGQADVLGASYGPDHSAEPEPADGLGPTGECSSRGPVGTEVLTGAMRRLTDAAWDLLVACEADLETHDPNDADDESVGAGTDGPMAVQFGHMRRLRRAFLAIPAFAAPIPSGGWRKIRSAPKDGTMLLLWSSSPSHADHYIGRYETGESGAWHTDAGWFADDGSDIHPTHWMPLPSPPGALAGEAAQAAETEGLGSRASDGKAGTPEATPQATPTSPQDHPPSSNPAAVLREPGKGGRS